MRLASLILTLVCAALAGLAPALHAQTPEAAQPQAQAQPGRAMSEAHVPAPASAHPNAERKEDADLWVPRRTAEALPTAANTHSSAASTPSTASEATTTGTGTDSAAPAPAPAPVAATAAPAMAPSSSATSTSNNTSTEVATSTVAQMLRVWVEDEAVPVLTAALLAFMLLLMLLAFWQRRRARRRALPPAIVHFSKDMEALKNQFQAFDALAGLSGLPKPEASVPTAAPAPHSIPGAATGSAPAAKSQGD